MSKPNINNTPTKVPSPRRRFFKEGKLTCVGPGCGKPMPAGYYGKAKRRFICSMQCYNEFYLSKRPPVRCTYCGKKFQKRHTQRSKPFCSMQHFYDWRRQQTDEKKVGAFASLLREFMADCMPRFLASSSFNSVRCNLAAFFSFLRRKRIRSLESVTPRVISSFLADLQKTRKKSAGRVVGNIRLFFDWQIVNGKRKSLNPVIPKFHTRTTVTRLPRPYELADLRLIRSLVQKSGDPELQLAIAIGEESGLRISETCNLRISDVDLEKQQFFIQLPTKTRVERFAPFHDRTREALVVWLAKRPAAQHEYLFTGTNNIPLRKHTLRKRLNRLLCGPGKLNQFSYHRLRHSAASKVYPEMDALSVMETFGWTSPRVMAGYTRLLPESLRNSYANAMDQVERDGDDETLQPTSIEAYFDAETSTK
jgi:integrase/recombinase XerD